MLAGSFLRIAGELLDHALLQEVAVVQELNAHSWCDVVCRQTMEKRFPAEHLLGQELTLSTIDEHGASVDIFNGLILESELEYEIFGSQTARLRAVSSSYLMDVTPRREYYFQEQPQDVAQALVGNAGLSLTGKIDGQKLSYVQMEETDFRFLLRFVDESEQWLRPTADGIEVRDTFQPGATLPWRGEFGLVHFGVAGKLAALQSTGAHYDYRKMQSEVLAGVQDEPALYGSSAGMSSAAKAQAAKLGEGFVTARNRLLSVDDLSPRLKKESRRSTGKMVLCRGVSREQRLKAGDQVAVDGVLDANGTYGLIRVQHKWTVNGYENEFLCTPWKRYTSPEAAAVPRFDGVVSARVADNNDPEGLGRIQIQYYWQEDSFSCWIRAMTPHAGADRGVFCLPEIGDEVWVMFEEGDPERGRVLGSAWNGKMTPPREELWGGDTGPNDVKRMVTKSGHRISLDDKPGKNAIVVATPEHVKLSMMESSNETGDAMLALHSDGDVFLSAPAGRIHFHSKFWSREVGGVGGSPAGNLKTISHESVGSNPPKLTAPQAGERPAEREKRARLQERQRLIARGLKLGSGGEFSAAAIRLQRNCEAVELARLSDDVYSQFGKTPVNQPPPGWSRVGDEELQKKKINLQLLSDSKAVIYRTPSDWPGGQMTVLAFRGTVPEEKDDLIANYDQALAEPTAQYKDAALVGGRVAKAFGKDVLVTGHSLGGGKAQAAGTISGLKGIMFNSAGLNPATLNGIMPAPGEFLQYRTLSDPLTGLQNSAAVQAGAGGVALSIVSPFGVGMLIGNALNRGMGLPVLSPEVEDYANRAMKLFPLGVRNLWRYGYLAPPAIGQLFQVRALNSDDSPVSSTDFLGQHSVKSLVNGIEEQKREDVARLRAIILP